MIVLAVPYKSLIRCSINEFINYPPLGFYFILVGATSTRKFERDFNGKIEGNLRKDINSSSNRATFDTRKLACLCEHLLCCFAAYLADQGLAPQRLGSPTWRRLEVCKFLLAYLTPGKSGLWQLSKGRKQGFAEHADFMDSFVWQNSASSLT